MPPQKLIGKITQRNYKVLDKILQKEKEMARNVCLLYNPPINFGTILLVTLYHMVKYHAKKDSRVPTDG